MSTPKVPQLFPRAHVPACKNIIWNVQIPKGFWRFLIKIVWNLLGFAPSRFFFAMRTCACGKGWGTSGLLTVRKILECANRNGFLTIFMENRQKPIRICTFQNFFTVSKPKVPQPFPRAHVRIVKKTLECATPNGFLYIRPEDLVNCWGLQTLWISAGTGGYWWVSNFGARVPAEEVEALLVCSLWKNFGICKS